MDVYITTTTKTDKEAQRLLYLLGCHLERVVARPCLFAGRNERLLTLTKRVKVEGKFKVHLSLQVVLLPLTPLILCTISFFWQAEKWFLLWNQFKCLCCCMFWFIWTLLSFWFIKLYGWPWIMLVQLYALCLLFSLFVALKITPKSTVHRQQNPDADCFCWLLVFSQSSVINSKDWLNCPP